MLPAAEPEPPLPPASPADATVDFPPNAGATLGGACQAGPVTPSAPGEAVPADLRDHPRYRITRLVGQGGMGAVYEAEHLVMGRRVALKVIHPRYVSHPGAAERFRREVRSAARLHHPNIVTAFDAEQAGSTHFLVMEFVEGVTLAQLLKQRGPLPVAEACGYARQAALGLQCAHEQGMVHRDVKPDNLMLARDGTVKVLDFGLSRFGQAAEVAGGETLSAEGEAGGLTQAGAVMGTPDYVAPEQAADAAAADVRADLYSLGCSLYQMLAGRVPFPEGGAVEKFLAHAEKTPAPLAKLRPGLPRGLAEVVARLMAKRPQDRYRTPAEAAAALAPFAAPAKWKRSPLAPVLLAGLLGAGMLGAGVALITYVAWPGLSPRPKVVPAVEETFVAPDPAALAARPNPADAMKREAISPEALVLAGGGDPAKAPAELVAVFGGPRWRAPGRSGFPAWSHDGKRVATGSGHDVRILDADGRLLRRIVGPTDLLVRLKISPDGTALAATSFDRSVRLWDVATGRLRFCRSAAAAFWGVDFSPDGSAVAAVAEDGTGAVWDATTGEQRAALDKAPAPLGGLAFAPDGKELVGGCQDGRVLFWSAATGKLLRSARHGPEGRRIEVVFSPDGKRMATGSDRLVRGWDAAGGGDPRPLWEQEGAAGGLLVFTPDGASLWVAANDLRLARPEDARAAVRRDAGTGAEQARLTLSDVSYCACWALSPDGKKLAGGEHGSGAFLHLVDAARGKLLNQPAGHAGTLAQVAFSPDGRWLASCGHDRLVIVWDLATGKERHRLAGHGNFVRAVAFSPDGKTLASAGWDWAARLWDVETGAPGGVLTHPHALESVAFSADGKRLATGCYDNKARVWDLAGRTVLHTLEGHAGVVTSVRFGRAGRLMTGSYDGTVRVWEIENERLDRVLRGHETSARTKGNSVLGLAVLPGGRLLASTGDDGTVRLWPVEEGGSSTILFRAGDSCVSVAAGPDGRLLAASGIDGRLYLHDRSSAPPRRRAWRLFNGGGSWASCAFSAEGRYLAVANPDGTVYLLRLAERGKVPQVPAAPDTMLEERAFEGHLGGWVGNVALAGGGVAWTAGDDKAVRAWRVDDGKQLRALVHPAPVYHVALAPDGKAAVTAAWDGKLRLWPLEGGGEPKVWEGHTARVDGLAWSSDGKVIVSGSVDRTVRIWGPDGKARAVFSDHADEVWSVAVDKDGRRALASSKDGAVRLWDLAAGKALKTWEHQPPRWQSAAGSQAVCFAPDGKRAAWGAGDGTVRVRDLGAGRELLRLEVGSLYVRGLAFSPDGKRLLAGGCEAPAAGTLTLWDATTGRALDRVRLSGGVSGVAFTADGKRAVTSHGDGRARVWRMPP